MSVPSNVKIQLVLLKKDLPHIFVTLSVNELKYTKTQLDTPRLLKPAVSQCGDSIAELQHGYFWVCMLHFQVNVCTLLQQLFKI